MENKFKLYDKVKVINGDRCTLRTGDVGIITEDDGSDIPYRVTVEGKSNVGNWMLPSQLELVNEMKTITLEDGQEVTISEESYNELSKAVRKERVFTWAWETNTTLKKRYSEKEDDMVEIASDATVTVYKSQIGWIYIQLKGECRDD